MNEHDDVIRELESDDISLPDDELTVEKIRTGAEAWEIGDESFQFQVERHPTGLPKYMKSPEGRTAAREHRTMEYRYDRTTGHWETEVLNREFRYNPWLLIQAEFDNSGTKDVWEEKIAYVQNAENREATLNEEFEPVEEMYRARFHDWPDEKVEEMLTILKEHFRDKAGL